MKLVFPDYGGIMPRLDAESLPAIGAQTAENVDLTRGRLDPISVTGNIYKWHDDTNRISQIASGDFFQVGTPDAPTLVDEFDRHIFNAFTLNCREYIYVTYVNDVQELQIDRILRFNMIPKRVQWTDYGFIATYSKRKAVTQVFPNDGRVYTIHGPRMQVWVGNRFLPLDEPNYGDGVLPSGQIPLVNLNDPNEEQFGALECRDYSGPIWDNEIFVVNDDEITWKFPAHEFQLDIDLNYTYPTRRTVYYIQANVTDDAAANEGPASDISDAIIIEPGTEVKLNVVVPGRLYRSQTGGDDFLLIEEITSDTVETDNGDGTGVYVDRRAIPLGEELPPYGDYPDGASRTGSVVHPAGFAAIYYGNTVYPSEINKHHVYPAEWSVEFPTSVLALEVQAGMILVWTSVNGTTNEPGRLYALMGSNPEGLAKVEVSGTQPLLDARSICKVGQSVYYVSEDGLVMVSGTSTQLITEPFYTRVQWSALTPANFKARVADQSIFLDGSSVNLRIDLDEQVKAITTYTALTGVSLTWKSKVFVMDGPWRPNCARVRAASYNVTLKIYADETLVDTITVTSGAGFRLGRYNPARRWEVQVESAYAVDEIALASSMGELKNG